MGGDRLAAHGDLERGPYITAEHASLDEDPQQEELGLLHTSPLRGALMRPDFSPSSSEAPFLSEFEAPLGGSCSLGRDLQPTS